MSELVQEIWIRSATVFWEDIGLKPLVKQTTEERDLYARWWDAEVEPWVEKFLPGRGNNINPHQAGVWFADRHDAIKFSNHFQNGLGDFK